MGLFYDRIAHRRCKMQDLVEPCEAMLSIAETMCPETWLEEETVLFPYYQKGLLWWAWVSTQDWCLQASYIVDIFLHSAFFPLEGAQGRSPFLPDTNLETDQIRFFFSAKLLARNLWLKLALLSFCCVFKPLVVSPITTSHIWHHGKSNVQWSKHAMKGFK